MPSISGQFSEDVRNRFRSRVRLTGFVPHDELANTINNADIALAVYPDGPPGSGALCEVLSFGRPVIASCLFTFAEINKRGDCIKLVPAGCPFELAESILALIGNYQERLRLHGNAISFARKYNFAALAEMVLEAR